MILWHPKIFLAMKLHIYECGKKTKSINLFEWHNLVKIKKTFMKNMEKYS